MCIRRERGERRRRTRGIAKSTFSFLHILQALAFVANSITTITISNNQPKVKKKQNRASFQSSALVVADFRSVLSFGLVRGSLQSNNYTAATPSPFIKQKTEHRFFDSSHGAAVSFFFNFLIFLCGPTPSAIFLSFFFLECPRAKLIFQKE